MTNNQKKLTIGFIGAGKIAHSLSRAFNQAGCLVKAVASRRMESAINLAAEIPGCKACNNSQEVADACDLVFITTTDQAIQAVAGEVKWKPGQMAVHTSGADSANILKTAASSQAHTGVFHPLQTVASINAPPDIFAGSTITIEADEPLLETLKYLAVTLKANPVELSSDARVLYHASAVLISNYTVTLANMASSLWQTFGYSRDKALDALLPLLQGTVNNLQNQGLPGSLTGPVSRGDKDTVTRHIKELAKIDPLILETYRLLGLNALKIALEKGSINLSQAEEMAGIFTNKESVNEKNDA